jgi:DNA-directed RNA polymerase subunit RPC12/RpoP
VHYLIGKKKIKMSDWWDKKLRGEKPTPQPVYPNPVTYSNRPVQTQESESVKHNLPPNTQLTTGQAIRMWKGGEAHSREGNMRCPECGSRNVFSRVGKGSNSMVNGVAPAPRCFECGWNGKFSQADQTNWAI